MQGFLGGTWRLGFRSGVEAAGYGMRRMRALGPLLKARPGESGAATRGTRRCGEAASARTQESGLKTKMTWRAGPTGSGSGWEAGESRTTRPRLAGGVTPARARREGRSGLLRERAKSEESGLHRSGPIGTGSGFRPEEN